MARTSSILTAPRSARTRRASRAAIPADPMPRHVEPMLALLSAHVPPDGDEWAFEYKWDGVRAIGYHTRDQWLIESRNQLNITRRYPELAALHAALGKRSAVLDGEIVALDDVDRPSFTRLQRRMHVNDVAQIARLSREVPILYVLFDLLYLDGKSLVNLPYTERRQMLEELTLAGP